MSDNRFRRRDDDRYRPRRRHHDRFRGPGGSLGFRGRGRTDSYRGDGASRFRPFPDRPYSERRERPGYLQGLHDSARPGYLQGLYELRPGYLRQGLYELRPGYLQGPHDRRPGYLRQGLYDLYDRVDERFDRHRDERRDGLEVLPKGPAGSRLGEGRRGDTLVGDVLVGSLAGDTLAVVEEAADTLVGAGVAADTLVGTVVADILVGSNVADTLVGTIVADILAEQNHVVLGPETPVKAEPEMNGGVGVGVVGVVAAAATAAAEVPATSAVAEESNTASAGATATTPTKNLAAALDTALETALVDTPVKMELEKEAVIPGPEADTSVTETRMETDGVRDQGGVKEETRADAPTVEAPIVEALIVEALIVEVPVAQTAKTEPPIVDTLIAQLTKAEPTLADPTLADPTLANPPLANPPVYGPPTLVAHTYALRLASTPTAHLPYLTPSPIPYAPSPSQLLPLHIHLHFMRLTLALRILRTSLAARRRHTRVITQTLASAWRKRCSRMQTQLDALHGSAPATLDTAPAAPTAPTASRRLRDVIRSDADLQEVLAMLEALDPEYRAVQHAATIPAMQDDPVARQLLRFQDASNRVDPASYVQRLRHAADDTFTPLEQERFEQAYIHTPKRFGKILAAMGGLRDANECVLHFYRTKKATLYKEMLANKRGKRRRRDDLGEVEVKGKRRRGGVEKEGKEEPKKKGTSSSYWLVADMNMFPELLAKYGHDWEKIAGELHQKTAQMVQNHYRRHAEEKGWGVVGPGPRGHAAPDAVPPGLVPPGLVPPSLASPSAVPAPSVVSPAPPARRVGVMLLLNPEPQETLPSTPDPLAAPAPKPSRTSINALLNS